MILPEKKIAYIHIPRTGGTSVERAMLLSMGSSITQFGAPLSLKKKHAMDNLHRPLKELERLYDLTGYTIYATHRKYEERSASLIKHMGGKAYDLWNMDLWGYDIHFTESFKGKEVEIIPFKEMSTAFQEILGVKIPHLNQSK